MEIKVLTKTFDLLELVREYSPQPVLPGEAASAVCPVSHIATLCTKLPMWLLQMVTQEPSKPDFFTATSADGTAVTIIPSFSETIILQIKILQLRRFV